VFPEKMAFERIFDAKTSGSKALRARNAAILCLSPRLFLIIAPQGARVRMGASPRALGLL
jgi:hypothetical protein